MADVIEIAAQKLSRRSLAQIACTVVIAGLLAFSYDVPSWLGGWIGSMALPALIAYLMRGRKKNWAGFARWFFWLTIIMVGINHTIVPR